MLMKELRYTILYSGLVSMFFAFLIFQTRHESYGEPLVQIVFVGVLQIALFLNVFGIKLFYQTAFKTKEEKKEFYRTIFWRRYFLTSFITFVAVFLSSFLLIKVVVLLVIGMSLNALLVLYFYSEELRKLFEIEKSLVDKALEVIAIVLFLLLTSSFRVYSLIFFFLSLVLITGTNLRAIRNKNFIPKR